MFWCLTVPVDDRVDMLIPIHEACITPCRDANLGIPPEPAALPAGGVGDDLEPILIEHLAQRLSEPSDVRAPGTDHSCAYEEGTPPQNLQKTSSVHPLPSKKAKPAELAGWLKKCAMPAEYTKIVRMHCTSLSPHHSCSGVFCDLDIIFEDRTPPYYIGSLPLRHSEGMNLVRPKS